MEDLSAHAVLELLKEQYRKLGALIADMEKKIDEKRNSDPSKGRVEGD